MFFYEKIYKEVLICLCMCARSCDVFRI